MKEEDITDAGAKTSRRNRSIRNPFQGDVEELVNIGNGDCTSEEVRCKRIEVYRECGAESVQEFCEY